MEIWKLILVDVNNMKMTVLKASKHIYIIFGIMFGWMPISISILAYLKGTIERDLPMIFITLGILFIIYIILSIYKITYNNRQIKYRGLFGTKIVNIDDIKDYKIKAKVHSISTKPILGLFKITIIDPSKPIFGLAIDTIKKKSEIIIPVKLFSSKDLNILIEYIENKSKNLEKRKRKKVGESVFKY